MAGTLPSSVHSIRNDHVTTRPMEDVLTWAGRYEEESASPMRTCCSRWGNYVGKNDDVVWRRLGQSQLPHLRCSPGSGGRHDVSTNPPLPTYNQVEDRCWICCGCLLQVSSSISAKLFKVFLCLALKKLSVPKLRHRFVDSPSNYK